MKRKADKYMTFYVKKQSKEIHPPTGELLNRLYDIDQKDAFNMSILYSFATDYQRLESLVRLPDPEHPIKLCTSMSSFKDRYMRMDEHCPLRDCILPLRAGEDVVTTLGDAFHMHGFPRMCATLAAVNTKLAVQMVPDNQRFKKDNMVGILDILIRVLVTPTRSVSVPTWETLSLLVKTHPIKKKVFLGITALEAFHVIHAMFVEPGGYMECNYKFFSHHIIFART